MTRASRVKAAKSGARWGFGEGRTDEPSRLYPAIRHASIAPMAFCRHSLGTANLSNTELPSLGALKSDSAGIGRQPDGSYTGIDISPPPGQFLGSIPNIGRSLAACIPKPASSKSVAPGPDIVGGISGRTPSENYLFAQLNSPRSPQKRRIRVSFLKLLRTVRVEAGMRQEDLATAIGRKQAYISKYELGERRLDLLELASVCDALGITLETFAAVAWPV